MNEPMQAYTMPMTQTKLNPDLYLVLKTEVKNTFGRQINTAKECLELVEDIYHKTTARLSFNTLRRCFGLVKSQYPPSKATIKILINYCGYNSFEELMAVKKAPVNDYSVHNSLFLNYLINLFTNIPVQNPKDYTFNFLINLLIKYLNENEEIADVFQKNVIKKGAAANLYIERFINIDKLNSYYGTGLHHYIKETRKPEKKIFGYSLLCLRDWLRADTTTLAKNFALASGIQCTISSPATAGSFCAAELLYSDILNLDPERVFINAYNYHLQFKKRDLQVRDSFEYMYSRALIFTGHFEHALFYIDFLLENTANNGQEKDSFYHNLLLLKGIALSKTNNKEKANQIFRLLKPTLFNALSKKTDTILFMFFAQYVNQNNEKIDKQLKHSVAEAGFPGLKKMETF